MIACLQKRQLSLFVGNVAEINAAQYFKKLFAFSEKIPTFDFYLNSKRVLGLEILS